MFSDMDTVIEHSTKVTIKKDRKWWIIFAMSTSLSLTYLDQTGVALTLVSIRNTLNLPSALIEWVINGYLLSLASFMLLGGRLSDIFGHKRIFFSGMTIFICASLICAVSTSGWELIAGRVLQGFGGAFLIPTCLVLVTNNVRDEESGKFLGICLSCASLFLALGPMIGGLITQFFNWRIFFIINIPVGILSILLTFFSVSRDSNTTKVSEIDWAGFFTLTIALLSLVLALVQSSSWGWNSALILGLFFNFIIFITLFLIFEYYAKKPLVNLRLFSNHNFLGGNLVLLLLQTCHISSAIFWVFYLQLGLGFSAAKAGMFILPVTLPVLFCAQYSGRLVDYYGTKLPIMMGMMLSCIGILWVAYFAKNANYPLISFGFLLYGFGAPLVIPAAIATILKSVSTLERGMASGMANTMRQIGAALGIALIGAVITNQFNFKLDNFLAHSNQNIHQLNREQLKNLAYTQTNTITNHLSSHNLLQIHQIVRASYISAFTKGMFLAVLLASLAFLIAFMLIRNRPFRK